MKKLFFLLVTIVGLGFTANAQTKPAEFKFENETHDYGTIKQGADGNCEFKFKNTGKEPLIID